MKLERVRPTAVQLTLHPFELAALIATARWAADGAHGELPADAVAQVRRLLDDYDTAIEHQA